MVLATIHPASENGTALPAKKTRANPGKKFADLLGGLLGKKAASEPAGAEKSGPAARKTAAGSAVGKKAATAETAEKEHHAAKKAPRPDRLPTDGKLEESAGLTLTTAARSDTAAAANAKTGAPRAKDAALRNVGPLADPMKTAAAAPSRKISAAAAGAESSGGAEEKARGKAPSRHERRIADFKEKARAPETKTEVRREEPEVKEKAPGAAEESKKEAARETLEIRVSSRQGGERVFDLSRPAETRNARDTAAGILRQLREEGNEKLVRSARVILRDRDNGEIRLILKPERLGEVRIRLHLQDNLIGGRILVENESVREAFERNMPELASAFRAGGFDVGSLDVSVGGNAGRGEGGDEALRSFADGRKTAELARGVPSADSGAYYASHAVNIMA